jgi:hypothetical protein
MEDDQNIIEAGSAEGTGSVVNIESLMSPEDQRRLELLRANARMMIEKEEKVSGSVRAKLANLLSSPVGDLFRNRQERGRKCLERWQIKLREVVSTGEYSYPDGRLFPRLELVKDAAADIYGISAETDAEVPPELFAHMHGILMDALEKQRPWWRKDARARLADLGGKIDQYKIVAESGNGNSKSMATDLAKSFDESAKTFVECSNEDWKN